MLLGIEPGHRNSARQLQTGIRSGSVVGGDQPYTEATHMPVEPSTHLPANRPDICLAIERSATDMVAQQPQNCLFSTRISRLSPEFAFGIAVALVWEQLVQLFLETASF